MLEKLAFEMEFNKTEKWLISGKSDQSEVLEMKSGLLLDINRKIQELDDESKKLLNQYNDLHNELLPLVDNIEQVGIDFDIDKLRKNGKLLLDNSKSENNRYRIEKSLEKLLNSLEGSKLKTKLNLIGGVTHRITTASYNIQGLPNEIKACIIPSQYKRVFTIDFSAFEPSVAAYMSDDKALIAYLKSDDGLYERLLKDLNLSSDYRNAVKVCFIGSFLFGGNYRNFKLNEEVPEREWHNLIKKFSDYMLLKNQVITSKKLIMPYGIENDVSHLNDKKVMGQYVQNVSSYIFKHVLNKVYIKQCINESFRIMLPIHDAIMIECDTEEVAQSVANLMEETANSLFEDSFAEVTIEEIGGRDNE
ncbi:hypothetical protein JTF04_06380 [Mammaliicoccus vitulinus]|uniref:DNA polymerase n=1 Tax=Mammaliicoccus vitulinus TaxID=71237 RepID=UPI00195280C0|nr:DNA polymerase [Mammaliicoccus vitulinus]MBM6629305.1 hypothetical protein [Mammaliicoccus vitulinus]